MKNKSYILKTMTRQHYIFNIYVANQMIKMSGLDE